MNEIIENNVGAGEADLSRWMGRRETFSLIAGVCTAADVASLRFLRDSKSYRSTGSNWAEFCIEYLRVNRRTADRAIANLNEFGPSFFLVTQMAHINPAEYRRIARHISGDAINLDGTMVALLPENRQAVSDAVRELLRRLDAEQPKPAPAAFDALLKRCRNVAETLSSIEDGLDGDQKAALADAIGAIRSAAEGLGVGLAG